MTLKRIGRALLSSRKRQEGAFDGQRKIRDDRLLVAQERTCALPRPFNDCYWAI